MDTHSFLTQVLPDSGKYCIVHFVNTDKGPRAKQAFVNSIDDALTHARNVGGGVNMFFALAAFGDNNKRSQDTAERLRALWIDLDVDPDPKAGKKYPSKKEALLALKDFCTKQKMPRPTVVDSGYGVHAYWPLTHEVDKSYWFPVASQLRTLCIDSGLRIDTTVTADSARILRLPGSHNMKNPNRPKDVSVITVGEPHDIDMFSTMFDGMGLPAVLAPPPRSVMQSASAVTMALMGGVDTNFSKIARKSLKGTGCAFIANCVKNQADVSEPEWRAALSIAWVCDDADTAVHKISSRHPDYTPERTLEKASLTNGPYLCKTIRNIWSGCADCDLKISSPVVLGKAVAVRESPEADRKPMAEVETEEDADAVIHDELHAEEHNDDEAAVEDIDIDFDPPSGYVQAKSGAIYRMTPGEDGEDTHVLVYENTLFISERVRDPNDGDCVIFKLVLPVDGLREFSVPMSIMQSNDKFKQTLAHHGVAANQVQMREIMEYSIKFIKELQHKQEISSARLQYGWSDDYKKFIVGSRAYAGRTWTNNPAASTTADSHHIFTPTGSLETWTEIADTFAYKGLEAQQLAICAGFGAPLMAHAGINGALLNFMSSESGTGKTTAMHIALSIFGDPAELAMTFKDTSNAFIHKMGVMNNLMVGMDEISNFDPFMVSEIAYTVTQGRGKDRMSTHANTLRVNMTRWRTIMQTTSNASLFSKLSKLKARPDGELMRVLEFHVGSRYVDGATELHQQLSNNYGVAGEVFAPWLVGNRRGLARAIDAQRLKMRTKLGTDQAERFRLGTAACALLGGKIACKLGLINFNMEALEDWCIQELKNMRRDTRDNIVANTSVIGEFLMQNIRSLAIIDGPTSTVPRVHATLEPSGNTAVARFEMHNARLFVSKKQFREYCVDRNFSFRDVLMDLSDIGQPIKYIENSRKRLLANTSIKLSPSVDTLVFECAPEELEMVTNAVKPDMYAD